MTALVAEDQLPALQEMAQKGGWSLTCGRRHGLGQLLDMLRAHGADMIVLAGFLGILGPKVLEAYSGRIINIHPALIPSFCGKGFYGLHVHEAVLARGCKVTGATAHLVTAGVDEGPILLQKAVDVLPGDTPEILQRRVMEQAEWLLLPRAVKMLAEEIKQC